MQCGLCAVVAGLFRRAMCIAGSRRGSGESTCYQELPAPSPGINLDDAKDGQRPSSDAMLDYSSEHNALMLQISKEARILEIAASTNGGAAAAAAAAAKMDEKLDELERLLLAKFDVSHYRPKHTGRFLTMHKRRRKRLITRSLDQDPGLLDDVTHGQVQCVLQRVTNWKFNAFILETATGGRSLSVLCVHLFHWYGLLEHFNLDVVRVWKLFTLIEEGYHSTNPYHNSIHAADVTQAMHCFLQVEQIRRHLTFLEIMAALIAAVTHDLDHPGVNQPFLVATRNHLAALYGNKSVLENHHWRSAVCCLLESGVLEQLPDRVRPQLQQDISSLILATDITRQQEFLTQFKKYLDDRELCMENFEHRHFILQIALKCADISNPCRPWEISQKWAQKVCEEFFRQGDYERQLNLPVTAICDRHATSIPKIQVGFFKFVVFPLYEEWHRFINDSFSHDLMQHLKDNQQQWEVLLQNEIASTAKLAEESAELQAETNIDLSEGTEEDSVSLEMNLPRTNLAPQDRVDGRRHSVPLGVSRSLTLAPRPTTTRRESLPGGASLMPSRISSRSSLQRSEPSPNAVITVSSSMSTSAPERPVSAENLLPDTSIASIANSLEASKLSSLVQQQPWEQQLLIEQQSTLSSRQGTLTRQQTFPPVQPFARMRYMSTTAEMSQCCTEVLFEADSSSSRSVSPAPEVPASTESVAETTTASTEISCSAVSAELRRHSTPAQSKSRAGAVTGSSSGRRFTTIPLTQDTCQHHHNRHHHHHQHHSHQHHSHQHHHHHHHQQQQQHYHHHHPHNQPEQHQQESHKVFFIGSPPDSPPRHASATPSSESGSGSASGDPRKSIDSISLPGNKRDYSDIYREKNSKMLKLMKENVDPRGVDELSKPSHTFVTRRSNNQGWARRRGSAPVGLLAKMEDSNTPNRSIGPCSRRGSVPADIAAHPSVGVNRCGFSFRTDLKVSNKRRSSLPHEAALGNLFGNVALMKDDCEIYPLNNNNNNNNNNSGSNNNGFQRLMADSTLSTAVTTILSSRRGSVPADISELRHDLIVRGSQTSGNSGGGGGGKSRNCRSAKKLLRRRSSGGPEMFASGGNMDGNDNGGTAWPGRTNKRDLAKREETAVLAAKRRGSLPVEMLAVSLTGKYLHR